MEKEWWIYTFSWKTGLESGTQAWEDFCSNEESKYPRDQFKGERQDKALAWVKQLEFFTVSDILVEVNAGHTHPCKAEAI